jgi:ATP-dependent RNA helicase DDX24/MAK5
MEGFCGLEELTEYPDDLAGFPGAHEPTGAGAAAAAAVAEVAPAGVEVAGEGDAVGVDAGAGATKHETTTDSTDTTPRKRKHSDPIASMSQADDGEVVDPAELERGAKKRKKKRKKRTMSSETASDDGRSPTLEWNGRGERVPSMFDEAEEDMLLDSVDIPVVPGADADAEEAVPEVKKKKKRKGKGKGVLKAAAAAAKAAAEAAEAAGVSVDKATPVAAESELVAAAVEAAPVLTAAEIGDAMPEWRSFGLPDPLMQMLHEQGFDEPTPVQAASIPQALQHRRDVLGAAATGSGKTLAFGLPILARMLEMRAAGEVETGLQALVLTPTRELAIQVHDHLTTAAKHTGIRVAAIVGGLATVKQSRLLKHKPGIVVATPGRLWELIFAGEPHFQTLNKLRFLVIDEADRMAEKGHYKELRQILDLITGGEASRAAAAAAKADAGGTVGASKTPIRQNFIFSATLFLGGGKQKKKRRGGAEEKAKVEGEDDASVQYIADLCGLADGHARIDLCGGSKKVAEGLTEARISCTKEEKDRYLYYFLHKCVSPSLCVSLSNLSPLSLARATF